MDLFLETPQQKADRILRQQERLLEMQAQAAADPYGGMVDGRAGAFFGDADNPLHEDGAPAGEVSSGGAGYPSGGLFANDRGGRARRAGGLFGRGPSGDAVAARACESQSRPEDYSVQQEEYRRELDYDRGRARRRAARTRLHTLAMIVLVPLGLIAIFLVSYSLTCILNGATPEEVVQHLSNLYARLASAIQTAFPSS